MAKKKKRQSRNHLPRDVNDMTEKSVMIPDTKKQYQKNLVQKSGQKTMRQIDVGSEVRSDSFMEKTRESVQECDVGIRDYQGRIDPKKRKEARKYRQQKKNSSELSVFQKDSDFIVGDKKLGAQSEKRTEKERHKKNKKAAMKYVSKKDTGKKAEEYSVEKVFDKKTGTSKYVVLALDGKKPVKKRGSNKRKYYDVVAKKQDKLTNHGEAEDDYNVGVEATVEAEKQVEYVMGAVHDYSKNAPYRRYQKAQQQTQKLKQQERFLEKKNIKKDVAAKYSEFLKQNPELNEKSVKHSLQKQAQKRRIKKEYAKAFRSAKAGKAAREATRASQKTLKEIAKKVVEVAARNASLLGAGAIVLLFIIILLSVFAMCGGMLSQGVSGITTSTYTSVPAEIDVTDLNMTNLEMELQEEINSIETDYPDYDEYLYNLGEIGHDPFTLISYLSAVHESFTASEVQTEVEGLFNEMYDLELTPTTETRTRTETRTGTHTVENDDGTTSEEEYEYEVEVEYEVSILEVTLTVTQLEDVIAEKMNTEQMDLYQNYRVSNGMLQYFYSPLDLYWYNYVSSYYGYRVNPTTGTSQFHRGVDIAVPEGTAVYAAQDGTVITAEYHEEYGNYVVIQDSKGYVSKYAHLSTLNVSAGQSITHGRQIGKSGNTGTSTGSHLHIECMYNGEYYNPLFYFLTGEDTLYGERPGTSFNGDVEPPTSYDDPTAQALLSEAAKYIGYPYVWGGSSPSTSFDCSGFVCYAFTNSGVHELPRTTAQGIYNQCTSVPASDAQPGDIIFFTGTYASSGPVSHVGIYCGDGVMIHAGDPIKYSNINTSYWQSHFFSFGRLN